MSIPLSVLDLLPVSEGSTNHDAVRGSIDLARAAERFGYERYWFAEHHFHAGVIGVSSALALAIVGSATSSIRLGSAGVQFGHRTPLSVAEEFGLLDAAFPGRVDLGVGRSPGRADPERSDGAIAFLAGKGPARHDEDSYTANGLLLPKAFDPAAVYDSARYAATLDLLQQPGAHTPDYEDQVNDLIALFAGSGRWVGKGLHAHPAEGADVALWILGTSGGSSAQLAGRMGLPFIAGYHHSPSTVIDAVASYREAFASAGHSHRPVVAVSADAVVAETDERARELASGFAPWVLSIRSNQGAIRFPSPVDAAARHWTDDERALVSDRVRTQVVGSPGSAAGQLRRLVEASAADELIITTITHDRTDRVRSYELLAEAWAEL